MKHLLTISIFVLIALVFWGLQTYEQKKSTQLTALTDPHFIDVFMHDFKLTSMNKQGQPAFTLKASSMEHFNDSDLSIISEPVIELLEKNNRWSIHAQHGEINDDKNHITLTDNVVMLQMDATSPIELHTEHLEIDTRNQIARSHQQVHIRQNQFELKSKGMVLNNRTGKLELLASVEGRYNETN